MKKGWQGQNSNSGVDNSAQIKFFLVGNDKIAAELGWGIKAKSDDFKMGLKSVGFEWDDAKWVGPLSSMEAAYQKMENLLRKHELELTTMARIPLSVFEMASKVPEELKFKPTNGPKNMAFKIVYKPEVESLRSIEDVSLDIRGKLYDFQKKGIEFGIQKNGRVLIADEMGVGKTIQALGLCAAYKDEWPVLIICPSSLRYNWNRESGNWLKSYISGEKQLQIIKNGNDEIRKDAKVVIVSYSMASKKESSTGELFKAMFQVVVCDEAHALKSLESQRTKTLLPVIQKAKRVILLTGTPAFAKPIELYPLLAAIRPDIFKDVKQFGERYCRPTFNAFSKRTVFDGCQNPAELHFVLKNVMIRRLKRDVLTELPEKIRTIIDLKPTGKKMSELQVLLKSVGNIDSLVEKMGAQGGGGGPNLFRSAEKTGGGTEGDEQSRIACKLYQLTAEAKLPAVCEFLEEMKEYNEKMIIFAHHHSMLDGIQEFLVAQKMAHIRIDGKTTGDRGVLVQKFQSKSEGIKYALLSIQAMSVGHTLTEANIVIFAELDWTPANLLQAEDRAHRIGQEKTVLCYYLIAKDTIDQSMLNMVKTKWTNTSKILDGENASKFEIEKASDRNSRSMLSMGASKTGTLNDFFKGPKNAAAIQTKDSKPSFEGYQKQGSNSINIKKDIVHDLNRKGQDCTRMSGGFVNFVKDQLADDHKASKSQAHLTQMTPSELDELDDLMDSLEEAKAKQDGTNRMPNLSSLNSAKVVLNKMDQENPNSSNRRTMNESPKAHQQPSKMDQEHVLRPDSNKKNSSFKKEKVEIDDNILTELEELVNLHKPEVEQGGKRTSKLYQHIFLGSNSPGVVDNKSNSSSKGHPADYNIPEGFDFDDIEKLHRKVKTENHTKQHNQIASKARTDFDYAPGINDPGYSVQGSHPPTNLTSPIASKQAFK